MRTSIVFLALPALIAHVAAIAIEGPQALNQLSKRADPTFVDWPEAELPKKQKLETALFDAYMLVSYAQEHYDSFKYIWDKYFPESEHEKIKGAQLLFSVLFISFVRFMRYAHTYKELKD